MYHHHHHLYFPNHSSSLQWWPTNLDEWSIDYTSWISCRISDRREWLETLDSEIPDDETLRKTRGISRSTLYSYFVERLWPNVPMMRFVSYRKSGLRFFPYWKKKYPSLLTARFMLEQRRILFGTNIPLMKQIVKLTRSSIGRYWHVRIK
jgi:hypothetical protein